MCAAAITYGNAPCTRCSHVSVAVCMPAHLHAPMVLYTLVYILDFILYVAHQSIQFSGQNIPYSSWSDSRKDIAYLSSSSLKRVEAPSACRWPLQPLTCHAHTVKVQQCCALPFRFPCSGASGSQCSWGHCPRPCTWLCQMTQSNADTC